MSDDDDLVTAAAAPTEVKAAAAFCALAGLFVALTGLQVITVRWVETWRNIIPIVFLAIGVLLVPLGASLYRGRAKAAIAAFVLTTLATLGTCGWFVATWGSVFSLMNIAAVPLSVLAAVLSALSIPATRKMAQARERLADEGLDLGF